MTNRELAETLVEEFGLRYDPFALWMSDTKPEDAVEPPTDEHTCVISMIRVVPSGKILVLEPGVTGCKVAAYYLGFADEPPEGADRYFSEDGKRLKDSPERAQAHFQDARPFPRDEKYCLVSRLDLLPDEIEPDVVVVLADADSLSGLITLANFDRDGLDNVIAPFASGCGGFINEPLKEAMTPEPRAVIGMLDVMVRHLVDPDILSFAVPYTRLLEMIGNIEMSFMRGTHWESILDRKQLAKPHRD